MKVNDMGFQRVSDSRHARVLRVALAAATSALLAAACASCGSGSGSATNPANSGGATATGAGADASASLVAAAKKEGSITVYWSVDAVTAKNVADEFKKLYGITVNYNRIPDDGQLEARFESESKTGAPGADLVSSTDTPFFDAQAKSGNMVPVAKWGVPSVAKVPKSFQGDAYVVAGLFTLNNVLVNTSKVPANEIPKTWQQLADSKWKGVQISDDPRQVDTTMSIFEELDKLYGDNYLRKLAHNSPEYIASLVDGAQSVASGEKSMAYGIGQIHINPLLASAPNAPVKLVKLAGPVFGAQWPIALSAHAQHPEAAKLFLDWLFTPDGQKTFNKLIGPAVVPGVSIPGFPALGNNYVQLQTVSKAEGNRLLGLLGLPSQ